MGHVSKIELPARLIIFPSVVCVNGDAPSISQPFDPSFLKRVFHHFMSTG